MEDYCKYQQRLLEAMPAPDLNEEGLWAIFNPLFLSLGLNHFCQQTYMGLRLQVLQFKRHGQQLAALNMLLRALNHVVFWHNHPKKWWRLMRLAIGLAQDLHLDDAQQMSVPLRQLLKFSQYAPQPWQGKDVAYSFASFSLWSFQFGNAQKAVEQASIALHADPTWGYPQYLLGWYGLLLEGIDSVSHFVRAIQMNGGFLQKLKQDPLGQRFPDILQAVKLQLWHKQFNKDNHV